MKALINIFTAVLTGLNAGEYRNPANYTASENEEYLNSIGAEELDKRARELKPIEADGASGGDKFAEAVQVLARYLRPDKSGRFVFGYCYKAHLFNGHAVAFSGYFFASIPVEGAPSDGNILLCDLTTAKRPVYKRAEDRDRGRAWKHPDQIRRVLDGESRTAYAVNRAAALTMAKTGATYIQLAPGVVLKSSTLKRLIEAGTTKRGINAVLYFDGRLKIWTDTAAGIFGSTIITEPDELREVPAVLEAQQVSLCSLIRL